MNNFYSIGDMPSNLYKRNRFHDFTKSFISIGDDSAGNQILLKVGGENIGGLYFWEHEEVQDIENNLQFLAGSLAEFIEMLF